MAYTTTLFPSHCSAEEFLWPAIVLDKEPGIPGAHRSPGLALAMASSKLLLVLMAAASSLAAPQINEQKVVADVVASIGPKISEIIASLSSSSSSSSSRIGSTSTVSSGSDASSVSSSVVAALQPRITTLVSEAVPAEQCSVVSEEQCEVVESVQCTRATEQQCTTINEQQCRPVTREECNTVNEQVFLLYISNKNLTPLFRSEMFHWFRDRVRNSRGGGVRGCLPGAVLHRL